MFALFAADETCVATLEAALCPMMLGGKKHSVAAIRAVAVREDWRGRGLFRALMDEALNWSDDAQAHPTLLFTAEPDLYRAFGFVTQVQHAFVGAPCAAEQGPKARRLDLTADADVETVRALYAERTPLSNLCALEIDWPQFAANLHNDDALQLAFCADLDAVVVYEREGEDDITLVDVVARQMPTLAKLLGRIGRPARHVKVLFPPDRLGWKGKPTLEDTGLMIRGTGPAAMQQPFMLPPTVEF